MTIRLSDAKCKTRQSTTPPLRVAGTLNPVLKIVGSRDGASHSSGGAAAWQARTGRNFLGRLRVD
jgi:hypothetical protein